MSESSVISARRERGRAPRAVERAPAARRHHRAKEGAAQLERRRLSAPPCPRQGVGPFQPAGLSRSRSAERDSGGRHDVLAHRLGAASFFSTSTLRSSTGCTNLERRGFTSQAYYLCDAAQESLRYAIGARSLCVDVSHRGPFFASLRVSRCLDLRFYLRRRDWLGRATRRGEPIFSRSQVRLLIRIMLRSRLYSRALVRDGGVQIGGDGADRGVCAS